MFCFKCGKEIDDKAVFCPYCGAEISKISNKIEKEDEYIIYNAKKHWITLAPCLIFGFFAFIFLIGKMWIIFFAFLFLTLYPYLRYKFDKIEITNKSFNLQQGVLNIHRINMPLNKINTYYIKQSILGRMLNYGTFIFQSAATIGNSSYNYITNPNELVDIINNIEEYKQRYRNNLTEISHKTEQYNPRISEDDIEYLKFRQDFNIEDEDQ